MDVCEPDAGYTSILAALLGSPDVPSACANVCYLVIWVVLYRYRRMDVVSYDVSPEVVLEVEPSRS